MTIEIYKKRIEIEDTLAYNAQKAGIVIDTNYCIVMLQGSLTNSLEEYGTLSYKHIISQTDEHRLKQLIEAGIREDIMFRMG